MGKMIESIAKSRGHEIVSIIDVDNRADFDTDAFRSADVAIEFTTPTAGLGARRQSGERIDRLARAARSRRAKGLHRRGAHALLGFELLARRGYLFGREQISGQNHERLSRLRRLDGGNTPCAQTRRAVGHRHHAGGTDRGALGPKNSVGEGRSARSRRLCHGHDRACTRHIAHRCGAA